MLCSRLKSPSSRRIASRLDDVSRSTVEMEKLLHYVEELLTKELDLKIAKIILFSQPGQDARPLFRRGL